MGFQEAKARRNIWLKGKNRVQRAAEIGIVQYHAALVALCYGSINARYTLLLFATKSKPEYEGLLYKQFLCVVVQMYIKSILLHE